MSRATQRHDCGDVWSVGFIWTLDHAPISLVLRFDRSDASKKTLHSERQFCHVKAAVQRRRVISIEAGIAPVPLAHPHSARIRIGKYFFVCFKKRESSLHEARISEIHLLPFDECVRSALDSSNPRQLVGV